jgi:CBS domain-containing protein
MKEREFWREPGGGHVYAVELEDGLVTGSCGPLDVAEVDERFLPTFDYTPEQAEWLEERREEFELYHEVSPHAVAPVSSAHHVLALRPVSSAMHHGVITCHPTSTLRDVARTMANVGIHLVVVWGDEEDDSEGVWGVVTDVDLIAAAARGEALASAAVGAGHTKVVTVQAHENLLHAAHLMVENHVTHLLVLSDGPRRPIGVLSTLDLARTLSRAR